MLYNYTRGRFLENRRESDKVRKAPERADAAFKEVFLTGPAELVR